MNYSTAWPTGLVISASYNLLTPPELVIPMLWGQEWEGYAETQSEITLFGGPIFTKPPRHTWCLPPTLKEM